MIIDAFQYNGEADMLELRLLTLASVVDRFVICESDVSHSGNDQVIHRPDQQPRFAQWRSRMQPIVVTDSPRFWVEPDEAQCPECGHPYRTHTNTCWHSDVSGACACRRPRTFHPSLPRTPFFQKREKHQRDAIARIKTDSAYQGDDICFVSDVDEIWDPASLDRIIDGFARTDWVCCEQRMHGFALDYLHPHQPWPGTTVGLLADLAPQAMRDARNSDAMTNVPDAGCHLSWMGTSEERHRKLTSFSHGELVGKVDVDNCYREAKHSNGEQLERVEFPGDAWWPEPLLNGEFVIPPSWRAP